MTGAATGEEVRTSTSGTERDDQRARVGPAPAVALPTGGGHPRTPRPNTRPPIGVEHLPAAAYAPGWPGIPPRWSSSAKAGVGTALNPASRVWFTLSRGILDEIYYPHVDRAATRDLGLIVTDGRSFFSEEKRHARHEVTMLAPGVPAYRLVNTCAAGRYRTEKLVLADPRRDVVLQATRFVPLRGDAHDFRLYVLLAPHLANGGLGNTAWLGDYKGVPMLFARRGDVALALACSRPWANRSAGFVGTSDGWQDLARNKRLTRSYTRAENGNVALTGEVELDASGEFVLALGFGRNAAEAGYRARASLLDGFGAAMRAYCLEWEGWQAGLLPLDRVAPREHDLYRASTAVLASHKSPRFPGGLVASLSIPWGFARGDDDLGGYHLVWPRDLVEAAGGLLAAGARADARRVLEFLRVTQEADGHWPQNMWLDGTPYWGGDQLDETAFPILLVDLARREAALAQSELGAFWPMVKRGAGYLVRTGPVTQQDRWEEDPGYSPFTLAVSIAGLLAAAELAELADEPDVAAYLREVADGWNANLERWCYVEGTDLARRLNIDGYYVRIAPPDVADAASPRGGFVPIKNRPPDQAKAPAEQLVSPDALALVRFGLRASDDRRIRDTVTAIDALLRVDLPDGPAWHRYNDDGYGEHDDGRPFDGTGKGRPWPLLTGERAHYELAAGRPDEAARLLATFEASAGAGGMLPEQLWDGPDLPDRELIAGRPAGSAMPLVWAHAEYVKLRRSLHDGRVFDLPPQTAARYRASPPPAPYACWRFNQKIATMPVGKPLRIVTLARARVHWSADGWETVQDVSTRPTGLGDHLADLPTSELPCGTRVVFTFYWPDAGHWEGADFAVLIGRERESG